MPLSFDDDEAPEQQAPPPAAREEPAETPAPGQLLYEALAQVVSEQDEATLLALVEALREPQPWGRLSRRLRGVLADLDGRLFAEEE